LSPSIPTLKRRFSGGELRHCGRFLHIIPALTQALAEASSIDEDHRRSARPCGRGVGRLSRKEAHVDYYHFAVLSGGQALAIGWPIGLGYRCISSEALISGSQAWSL
jgi:hypothetical protein